MESPFMHLKILLPFKVFTEATRVKRIIAETSDGSFGFLPNRLDCVSALIPGILTYETTTEGIKYLAVDEGILVKEGLQVLVSVRNAIGGAPLGQLRGMVEKELVHMDETEIDLRSVMAKLESGFIRKFEKLKKE